MNQSTPPLTPVPAAQAQEPMITGYAVWKLVKKELERQDLPTIPPQMVYSYIQNKLIKSEMVGPNRMVRRSVADAWVKKYVTNKRRRIDEAQA